MPQLLELIIRARDEASAAIDGLKSKTQSAMTDMNAASYGAGLGMAGLALEIAAVRTAYEKIVQPAQDYILAVDELATKGQISIEEAAKWTTLATLLDIPIGTIETAFREMNKNGISPTIENLSGLSEDFLAIEEPSERAAFAADQFGAAAGQEMQKALELTPAGIDKLTESVGLVVKPTDDATEAAKNLALAQGALDAAILKMTVDTGTALMPWAIGVISTIHILFHPLDFLKSKIGDVIGAFETLFRIGSRNLPSAGGISAPPASVSFGPPYVHGGGNTYLEHGLALGGEVGTGGEFVVGEHGAERFTPRVPGTVHPNNDSLATSIDRMVKALPTIIIDAIERSK